MTGNNSLNSLERILLILFSSLPLSTILLHASDKEKDDAGSTLNADTAKISIEDSQEPPSIAETSEAAREIMYDIIEELFHGSGKIAEENRIFFAHMVMNEFNYNDLACKKGMSNMLIKEIAQSFEQADEEATLMLQEVKADIISALHDACREITNQFKALPIGIIESYPINKEGKIIQKEGKTGSGIILNKKFVLSARHVLQDTDSGANKANSFSLHGSEPKLPLVRDVIYLFYDTIKIAGKPDKKITLDLAIGVLEQPVDCEIDISIGDIKEFLWRTDICCVYQERGETRQDIHCYLAPQAKIFLYEEFSKSYKVIKEEEKKYVFSETVMKPGTSGSSLVVRKTREKFVLYGINTMIKSLKAKDDEDYDYEGPWRSISILAPLSPYRGRIEDIMIEENNRPASSKDE